MLPPRVSADADQHALRSIITQLRTTDLEKGGAGILSYYSECGMNDSQTRKRIGFTFEQISSVL